jgi:alpha-ketoglutarate-dependent taurine dioxygenase
MNPDSVTVATIESGLAALGYHVLRESIAIGAFYHLAKLLGSVVRIEDIRLGITRRGAHSHHELGLHSDQRYVDLIAWYCVRPAPEGGSTLLVDTAPALASLTVDERELLTRATMRCPDVNGVGPSDEVPLLRRTTRGERVYYAAWNVAPLAEPAVNAAFKRFSAAVESAPRIAVRLEAGQCLFLDNTRMLHGRGELPADSPRVLKRFWIQRTGSPVVH